MDKSCESDIVLVLRMIIEMYLNGGHLHHRLSLEEMGHCYENFRLQCNDNTDNTSLPVSWYSVSEKLTLTDTIIQSLILVSRMRIAPWDSEVHPKIAFFGLTRNCSECFGSF